MGKSQKQVADDFNKSNRKKLEIPRLESASGQGSGARSNNEPANKSLGHVVRRLDGALEHPADGAHAESAVHHEADLPVAFLPVRSSPKRLAHSL